MIKKILGKSYYEVLTFFKKIKNILVVYILVIEWSFSLHKLHYRNFH